MHDDVENRSIFVLLGLMGDELLAIFLLFYMD